MMTRKDYVQTADILNSYSKDIKQEVLEDMAQDFIDMFAKDNPNFRNDIFWNSVFEEE